MEVLVATNTSDDRIRLVLMGKTVSVTRKTLHVHHTREPTVNRGSHYLG